MSLSTYHALVMRAFKAVEKGRMDDARALIERFDGEELIDVIGTWADLQTLATIVLEGRDP